ncbi:HNH endonuclease [Bradyrhizobium sp. Ec3.3]|uniref:HNH endonuclease n=1 Tax=Bradyrhizobium sp. Ec3.3 TaxID=189753 RepID=UPI0012EC8E7E|nr:HNH endonuclease [Bradyrhizobium sp. Ec3.3]
MATKEQFRDEIRKHLREAELRGSRSLDLNSGTLHRQLGGYPGSNHQMPSCCRAMYDEQIASEDKIVTRPKKGFGASLTIRYSLPRRR